MLVLSVGVREAARQMGINEKTVLHWSHTGNWLAHTRPQPAPVLPLSMQSHSVVSVKPADALQNTLLECKGKTRVGLAKWAAKSATHLATLEGEEAAAAHQPAVGTATVMGKLWPEQGPQSVRISMFAPTQVIDIEGERVELLSSSGEHRSEAEVADNLPSCGTDVEQA